MTTESATPSIELGQMLADVCSLPPDQLSDRLAMVKREIRPHVTRRVALENGLAFEFASTDEMRSKLEDLAKLERQCCGPLDFAVREDGQTLRFEILGADPKGGAFVNFDLDEPTKAKSQPAPESTRGGWMQFAKTGGIAAAGSFFLFCVVPIGLVSIFGASIAAPLLKLDNPWVIAVGALALGTALWRFEKRRSAKRREALPVTTGDCC